MLSHVSNDGRANEKKHCGRSRLRLKMTAVQRIRVQSTEYSRTEYCSSCRTRTAHGLQLLLCCNPVLLYVILFHINESGAGQTLLRRYIGVQSAPELE